MWLHAGIASLLVHVIAGATLQELAVESHNRYRSVHGAPPVKWDSDLADQAQEYADRCEFKHSGMVNVGENLGWGFRSMESVIAAWYSELVNVDDFDTLDFAPDTGHFTQVVWRSTKTIGCAKAQQCALWICQYSPPGNYRGQFQKNVLPPKYMPPPVRRPLGLLLPPSPDQSIDPPAPEAITENPLELLESPPPPVRTRPPLFAPPRRLPPIPELQSSPQPPAYLTLPPAPGNPLAPITVPSSSVIGNLPNLPSTCLGVMCLLWFMRQ